MLQITVLLGANFSETVFARCMCAVNSTFLALNSAEHCSLVLFWQFTGSTLAVNSAFRRDSTGANNSNFQTSFSTVLSDGVNNSRLSCSSLVCDQEVMPTASKTKNFSLFVSEGFAHDFKPRRNFSPGDN